MKSSNSLLVGPVTYLGIAIVICGGLVLGANSVLASEEPGNPRIDVSEEDKLESKSPATSVSKSMTSQICLSSSSIPTVVVQQSTLLDFARELSEDAGHKKIERGINSLILSEIINVETQVDGSTTVTLQIRGRQKPESFKPKTEVLLVSPAELHAKNSEIIGLQQVNRGLQQQLAELQQQYLVRMRVPSTSLPTVESAPGFDVSSFSSGSSATPFDFSDTSETLLPFHSDAPAAKVDPLYFYPHRSQQKFLERVKGNREKEEGRSPNLGARGIVASRSFQGNLSSAHGAEADARSPKSAPAIGSPKDLSSDSLFGSPSLSLRVMSPGGSPKVAPTPESSKGVLELSPRLVPAASSPRVMGAEGSGSFSKFLSSSSYPSNFRLGGKADDSEPSSPILARSMSTTSVSSTSSGSTSSTRSSTSSISARALSDQATPPLLPTTAEQRGKQSGAGGSGSAF